MCQIQICSKQYFMWLYLYTLMIPQFFNWSFVEMDLSKIESKIKYLTLCLRQFAWVLQKIVKFWSLISFPLFLIVLLWQHYAISIVRRMPADEIEAFWLIEDYLVRRNLVFVAEIFPSEFQKYFHLSFCNFLRSNPILTSTTFFPYKCRTAEGWWWWWQWQRWWQW